jgi:hypothetical protein
LCLEPIEFFQKVVNLKYMDPQIREEQELLQEEDSKMKPGSDNLEGN